MEGTPYADLQTFNAMTNSLLEMVNTQLNHPFSDAENLKILQMMLGKMIETSHEMIVRKLDRAVAEQIASNLYAPSATSMYYTMPPLSIPMEASNKRKMSDLDGTNDLR